MHKWRRYINCCWKSRLKDLTNIDMGAVYVYKKATDDTGVYNFNQTLTSPIQRSNREKLWSHTGF